MAGVRRLQQLQGFENIYAPYDGVVTARNTDIGALITGGVSAGARCKPALSPGFDRPPACVCFRAGSGLRRGARWQHGDADGGCLSGRNFHRSHYAQRERD